MALTNDYKKGMVVLYKNEPHLITDVEHSFYGRGMAHYKLKLKNLSTGRVIPITIKSVVKMEELEVNYKNLQFLYADDTTLYFMDPDTYEQLELSKDSVGDMLYYMKAGDKYTVGVHNGKIIYIKPPAQVTLEVTETAPAVKGNTAQNATKEAVLETGAKIQVPLFIKVGDKIKVNPETNEYAGKAK